MPVDVLDSDATIATVVDKLKHPEEYVRRVLENMYASRLPVHRLGVRIGISGRGIIPNYKIEYVNYENDDGTEWFDPRLHLTFNGSSHKPRKDSDSSDFIWETWSLRHMEFEEVRMLLGDLREMRKSVAIRT